MPIDKILSVKNARAWVSMVSYSTKLMEIEMEKGKKNPGSQLGFACKLAQPIQPNFGGNGLDWLCYLAGNF